MKGGLDTVQLQLDYMMCRLALEGLVYAVSEDRDIDKHMVNARTALQWALTLDEYDENCEGCEDL